MLYVIDKCILPCVVNVHLLARDQARHELKTGEKE